MFWLFRSSNAQKAESARRQFVGYLRLFGEMDADYSGAELVFGELIGNVVRHAPGPIQVRVDWTERFPQLTVTDRGPGFIPTPTPTLPDSGSESGRGMFLVSQFCDDLRVERDAGGSAVSVRLRIPRRAGAAS